MLGLGIAVIRRAQSYAGMAPSMHDSRVVCLLVLSVLSLANAQLGPVPSAFNIPIQEVTQRVRDDYVGFVYDLFDPKNVRCPWPQLCDGIVGLPVWDTPGFAGSCPQTCHQRVSSPAHWHTPAAWWSAS